ncbi:hypothetical protein [Mycobacteroides abscessus]|uniref:hypothetical protein n=1 Tax=Mycobacteroides abscessus TaxID=36809 RepID=UPI0012FFEFFB|nr:hypothetical protein [Mycobacteroides abscessus]
MAEDKNSLAFSMWNGDSFAALSASDSAYVQCGVATESHAPVAAAFGDKIFVFFEHLDKDGISDGCFFTTINASGFISTPKKIGPLPSIATVSPVAHNGSLYLFYKDGQIEDGADARIYHAVWDRAQEEFSDTDGDHCSIDRALARNNQILAAASFGGSVYLFGSYSTEPECPVRVYKDPQNARSNSGMLEGVDVPGVAASAQHPMAATVHESKLTLVYQGTDSILYKTQRSEGESWPTTPVRLGSTISGDKALAAKTGPTVSVHASRLKLAYSTVSGQKIVTPDDANKSVLLPKRESVVGYVGDGTTSALVAHPTSGDLYLITRTNIS